MKVAGTHYRTVWQTSDDPLAVWIIDQRFLPFQFQTERLATVEAVAVAIRDMQVRGAGCIGATAGWGMFLAAQESGGSLARLEHFANLLKSTRPTAVNLAWAVDRQMHRMVSVAADRWVEVSRGEAEEIANEDAAFCRKIGRHGLELLLQMYEKKQRPLQILTHCNAGWLAFVDYGSATAPIYAGHDAGVPLHVWVDETRPRNQGARLTAWELRQHGVSHTVIVDNAGGHLMQRGLVDLVIVGADRVTGTGDVANKIGTYLKALAAHDNGIPFYVALPSSTFDWTLRDGLKEIPIEERSPDEVGLISGWQEPHTTEQAVRLLPDGCPAANPAFDVTPARLVTGLITERGICEASESALRALFP